MSKSFTLFSESKYIFENHPKSLCVFNILKYCNYIELSDDYSKWQYEEMANLKKHHLIF